MGNSAGKQYLVLTSEIVPLRSTFMIGFAGDATLCYTTVNYSISLGVVSSISGTEIVSVVSI